MLPLSYGTQNYGLAMLEIKFYINMWVDLVSDNLLQFFASQFKAF